MEEEAANNLSSVTIINLNFPFAPIPQAHQNHSMLQLCDAKQPDKLRSFETDVCTLAEY